MEKKGLSLFQGYLIVFFVVIYIGVLLLSWFQTGYLMNLPGEFVSGLKVTGAVAILITSLIALAAFAATRKFQKIVDKHYATGEPLTEEELKTAIGSYSSLNKVSVVGIVAGFAVGNSIVVFIKYKTGVYSLTALTAFLALAHALTYAGLLSIIIVYLTDYIFAKFRKQFKIHSLDGFKMGWSVSRMIMSAVILSFLFIIVNQMMVPFFVFSNTIDENAPRFVTHIVISSVLLLVPTVFIVVIMLKALNERITSSADLIQELADGSATDLIPIQSIDNFGRLASATNNLIEKQRSLIANIHHEINAINQIATELHEASNEADDAISSVKGAYKKISGESQSQAQDIDNTTKGWQGLTESIKSVENEIFEQSKMMQDSSASITEMTENINSLANMTEKGDAVSKNLSQICAESSEQLKNATAAILAIQDASKEIVEIIKAIQKISSQTNMLSMNAAIEAAHAGKYGAGFAVVADEVRSLATSSSKSAKDIQQKIKDMTERVEAGVDAIDLIENAFKQIEVSVQQNAEISSNITSALHEQQIGAQANMEATRNAADNAQKVKELVIEQQDVARTLDERIENIRQSTQNMGTALQVVSDAAAAMSDVVSKIGETVNSNNKVVGVLRDMMEQFAGKE